MSDEWQPWVTSSPLSFSLLHYPTAFTVSHSLFFFSIALILLSLSLTRALYSPLARSLNPSSHFSFTPLLLCLLFFHSLIPSLPPPPPSSLVLFCLLSLFFSSFFSPLYAPPHTLTLTHTHKRSNTGQINSSLQCRKIAELHKVKKWLRKHK